MALNYQDYNDSISGGTMPQLGIQSQNQQPFIKNVYNPASSNGFGYLGTAPYIPNPSFQNNNAGQYGGTQQFDSNTSGQYNSNYRGGTNRNFSYGDIYGGGPGMGFDQNTPQGYNPYQFMPAFQQFQRPDSPIAGDTPEEEYLRQWMMGALTGPQQGQQASYDELLRTVQGDYMNPETNPYLTEVINALGADTTEQLNRGVNSILSRAGVGGALGGSRAALMQGQAAGETTRGFNESISNLLNQNYQQERGRQLQSTGPLVQMENIPILQAEQARQLAGRPREKEQALINAQMQEWLRQQSERLLPLQTGQSVLGQRMGQQIPIVQPQQSPWAGAGQLAQGVGSLASGFSPYMSSLGNWFSGGPGANPAAGYDGGYGNYDPFSDGYSDNSMYDWTSGFDSYDAGGW